MASPKTPNYKRQKWLLLLLIEAGGRLTRTDFQKYLFLLSQGQEFQYFDFVPYRYGCFSYQAMADLDTLQNQGWLSLTDTTISLNQNIKVQTGLPQSDIVQLVKTFNRYRHLRGRKLIRYVYENFPYYAVNSEIAEEILDSSAMAAIERERGALKHSEKALLTIGYEGLKFETYLNRLIQHDVRLLCDVRQNPLSRKYGFSRSTLASVLPKLGIEYTHIPELGIISAKRKGLEGPIDYEVLFNEYREDLPNRINALDELSRLIKKHRRVALTCFEAHHTSCHRHCISDYFELQHNQTVVHL